MRQGVLKPEKGDLKFLAERMGSSLAYTPVKTDAEQRLFKALYGQLMSDYTETRRTLQSQSAAKESKPYFEKMAEMWWKVNGSSIHLKTAIQLSSHYKKYYSKRRHADQARKQLRD